MSLSVSFVSDCYLCAGGYRRRFSRACCVAGCAVLHILYTCGLSPATSPLVPRESSVAGCYHHGHHRHHSPATSCVGEPELW